MRKQRRFLGVLVALFAFVLAQAVLTADADAPNVVSGNGITVGAWRWITSRTLEVDITSAKVSANSVNGPHRVRVTLPNDYFQSGATRYPVLYLMHGGAGGNSAQWTTGGGAAEAITNGRPLITVMPDGGKVGWFTNWVDQSGGAQAWRDFHIDQLIGWVDANFRTNAAKAGRAIAGLSMGGFGAIRYAQDRPDLFAYAGSFSGAVDLNNNGTRSVIGQQAMQNGYSPSAPFGNPFPPFDTTWKALDPVTRASRLAGVSVGLYVGSGTNDADPIERTMMDSAQRLHDAMNAAGLPHFYWMYGRPGPSAPFGCDGGHNFGCWNFALNDAVPRMMTVLQGSGGSPTTTTAPSATTTTTTAPSGGNLAGNPGFENPSNAPWVCGGQCGVDRGAGLARTGTNNGWVRNSNFAFNDIHQTLAVTPNANYTVTAWIRTSSNNNSGYLGLRTTAGTVVGERQFAALGAYTLQTVTVNSGANSSLDLYAGLWTYGDTWLQVDDVSVAPA